MLVWIKKLLILLPLCQEKFCQYTIIPFSWNPLFHHSTIPIAERSGAKFKIAWSLSNPITTFTHFCPRFTRRDYGWLVRRYCGRQFWVKR